MIPYLCALAQTPNLILQNARFATEVVLDNTPTNGVGCWFIMGRRAELLTHVFRCGQHCSEIVRNLRLGQKKIEPTDIHTV